MVRLRGLILASVLLLVIPIAFSAYSVNSPDDIYIQDYFNGYEVPYKASFVLSDYGGLNYPYHAYYADEDAGYLRFAEAGALDTQTTRHYSQYDTVSDEPLGTWRKTNAGVRRTFYYPMDRYSNSYFLEIAEMLDNNETAMRVALSRARKAVREELIKKYKYGIS